MLDDPSFRRGLRDGLPIFVAVGAFGIVYGVLAVQAGLPGWLTVLSSLIIVSGAAQFALVGLLDAGAAPVLIAVTGLALRHVPMSARLAQLVGPRPLRTRLALAWVLVDETFGLTVHAAGRGTSDLVAYKAAADFLLYSGWVLGTVLGAVLGSGVDPASWGADVFFALLFLGLAAPLVRNRRDWTVAALAVGAGLLATLTLPEAWQVTGAATAAALAGTAIRG